MYFRMKYLANQICCALKLFKAFDLVFAEGLV